MSKTAGLIKELDTRNFGRIQLPELHHGTTYGWEMPIVGTDGSTAFPSYEYCFYFAKGQKCGLSWWTLFDHLNELTNVTLLCGSARCDYLENLLFSEQTEDVFNSQEYKDAFEEYAGGCSFINGSMEDGYGLYIMKQSGGGYRMFYLHGLYRRHQIIHVDPFEERLYYYFHRSFNATVYSVDQLTSVFFFWDGDENSLVSMFTVPEDELNVSVRYTTGYNTPEILGGFTYIGWKAMSIGDLTDTALCTWDSSLEFVSYPVYPFQIINGAVAFDDIVTNWYGYTTPDSTDKILGKDLNLLITVDEDDSGSSGTGGGGGDYPTDSDDCKDPDATDLNTVNVVNSGLVTLYNPSMGGLQSFANFLFTGITDSIANQLKKLVSNPIDYVLFCSLCKFTPPQGESEEEITFCGIGTGVSSIVVPNQFHTIDCGTVEVPEDGKTFMDYSPHSQVQLYLPYCGIHQLSTNDIKGSKVHIKYNIDMLSGSCVASVEVKRKARDYTDATIDSSLYKFNGNCYLTMPLSATDWRGAYNSMIQFAGGIVATAGGNPMAGVGAMASAVTQQKVAVSRSGQGGSNYGHMSDGKPYFILSRPTPSIPYNFKGYEGYKSNVYYQVSELIGHGYTEIDENTLWSDNFGHATQEECQMIKDIMNRGVYL